jgi:hypothetical protein
MHAIKIYDVENYKLFHVKAYLDNVYSNTELGGCIIFSNKGYFAISRERFDQLRNKDEFKLLEIERLNQQGIVIGKSNQDQGINNKQIQNFSRQLVQEEVYWARYFLKLITAHLEGRESEGQKLTNHANVRILIGEVIQYIEEIEALLKLEALVESTKKYIAQVIRSACNHLAKLAGGRAFISSSVIEMLCAFEALNKIYLN